MKKVFFFFLLFFPLIIYSQESPELKEAKEALLKGDYDYIIETLEKARLSFTNSGKQEKLNEQRDIILMLASAYCYKGDTVMCRETMAGAFASPPSNIDMVDEYVSIAYLKDEKYEQGRAYVDRMIVAYPQLEANLLRLKASVYWVELDFEHAESLFQQSWATDSTNVRIKTDYGMFYSAYAYYLAQNTGYSGGELDAEMKKRLTGYFMRSIRILIDVYPHIEGSVNDERGRKFNCYRTISDSAEALTFALDTDVRKEQWLIDFIDYTIESNK